MPSAAVAESVGPDDVKVRLRPEVVEFWSCEVLLDEFCCYGGECGAVVRGWKP